MSARYGAGVRYATRGIPYIGIYAKLYKSSENSAEGPTFQLQTKLKLKATDYYAWFSAKGEPLPKLNSACRSTT